MDDKQVLGGQMLRQMILTAVDKLYESDSATSCICMDGLDMFIKYD